MSDERFNLNIRADFTKFAEAIRKMAEATRRLSTSPIGEVLRQCALVHSLGQAACIKGDHENVLPCPYCRAAL